MYKIYSSFHFVRTHTLTFTIVRPIHSLQRFPCALTLTTATVSRRVAALQIPRNSALARTRELSVRCAQSRRDFALLHDFSPIGGAIFLLDGGIPRADQRRMIVEFSKFLKEWRWSRRADEAPINFVYILFFQDSWFGVVGPLAVFDARRCLYIFLFAES